jgi:Protein of unknown function (DUF3631)
MPTFAAVVIAGNSPNLPEDTRSRIIRILLLPDVDGRIEESDWELIEEDALTLHDEIATWADQIREEVKSERPELPEGVKGRMREKWGPLKRVAIAAGGDWPEKVDAVALQDIEQYELDKEDGLINERPGVVLLRHIHKIWPRDDTGFLAFTASLKIIDLLVHSYPHIWGADSPFGKELNTKRLASMLARGYRIHSTLPGRGPGVTAATHSRRHGIRWGLPLSINPMHPLHPMQAMQ